MLINNLTKKWFEEESYVPCIIFDWIIGLTINRFAGESKDTQEKIEQKTYQVLTKLSVEEEIFI